MKRPLSEKKKEKFKQSFAAAKEAMEDRTQHITSTNNPELKLQVDAFVEMIENRYHFSGSYDVYTLYTTTNPGEEGTYALIHTDHQISEDTDSKEFNKTVLKEANILQRELIKTGIALDYFFIMPYTRIKDKPQSGYLAKVRVTRRKNKVSNKVLT